MDGAISTIIRVSKDSCGHNERPSGTVELSMVHLITNSKIFVFPDHWEISFELTIPDRFYTHVLLQKK